MSSLDDVSPLLSLFPYLFIAIFLLWVYCIVDLLRHDFEGNEKLIWSLVVVFMPLLGSELYLIMGRQKKVFK